MGSFLFFSWKKRGEGGFFFAKLLLPHFWRRGRGEAEIKPLFAFIKCYFERESWPRSMIPRSWLFAFYSYYRQLPPSLHSPPVILLLPIRDNQQPMCHCKDRWYSQNKFVANLMNLPDFVCWISLRHWYVGNETWDKALKLASLDWNNGVRQKQRSGLARTSVCIYSTSFHLQCSPVRQTHSLRL